MKGNDKLETEVLYWDELKDLIYSDRFVKITNEDQIVMGTGFESDPRLNKRKIKKVSATIYLKDEESAEWRYLVATGCLVHGEQ